MKVAIVRGAFLNQYEGQTFLPLADKLDITAFSSLKPLQDVFPFPVVKLASPMDIPFGPLSRIKMPVLNRLFIDAHWLFGLENKLNGFDIAHCAETYYAYTHQCLKAKRLGKVRKVVSTVWENIPFNNEGIWGRKNFKRQAIREVDHFIAVSEKAKEALILEGADGKKISVISPGIDTKRFTPAKKRLDRELRILFCGRLEKIKGIYEIIYAANELLKDQEMKQKQFKFILCGNGFEKDNLIKLIESLNISRSIEFISASYEEMPRIYQQADIFVAPSKESPTWQEQYGMVLAEAQASGLPIITTKTGSIPETVGNVALLIRPGDNYSLARNLKYLIVNRNYRERLGVRARKHAEKSDVFIKAKSIEEIYERVTRN